MSLILNEILWFFNEIHLPRHIHRWGRGRPEAVATEATVATPPHPQGGGGGVAEKLEPTLLEGGGIHGKAGAYPP